MAESYTHDIAAWMDGTESLTDGEYRAYHVVCQLIYLQEGPIIANEVGLAGRCKQHLLAFRANLRHLIAKGKLALADGKLTNRRSTEQINKMKSRRVKISQALRERISPQPPSDLPSTSRQPPPGHAANHLKSRKTTLTAANGDSLSSSFLPFLEDSLTQGVSEERSSGRDIDRVWNFDQFWMQYPHKVGKGAARKAFDGAMKKNGVMFDDVMAGLHRYAAKTDDRPWCNPATFLNQERWLDQPAPNGGSNAKRDETVAERTARLVDRARELEAESAASRAHHAF